MISSNLLYTDRRFLAPSVCRLTYVQLVNSHITAFGKLLSVVTSQTREEVERETAECVTAISARVKTVNSDRAAPAGYGS